MGKILVTGGTGYIGSHTVVELIQDGYDVVILDNLVNSSLDTLDRIKQISGVKPAFHEVDLCDLSTLKKVIASIGNVDAVIHFAALKSVGESVQQPLKYYNNNVMGLCNLLECMIPLQMDNIVFSSSATVYGSPEELPVTEDTPIGYTPSPYGYTKQVCERVLSDITHANELSTISLRYFNPIGAHSSGLIGELPSGIPNNLMPYITQTAAGIRESLSVFGHDYDTRDGTAIRDYIHVVDLAKAHLAAVKRLVSGKVSKIEYINIGTGRGSTVLEVIQSFEKTNNLKLSYQLVERRAGDVESIYAEVSKAAELLGWKTELDLDDMTKSSWEWEKKLRKID